MAMMKSTLEGAPQYWDSDYSEAIVQVEGEATFSKPLGSSKPCPLSRAPHLRPGEPTLFQPRALIIKECRSGIYL